MPVTITEGTSHPIVTGILLFLASLGFAASSFYLIELPI
jgi:hypothetical protein